MEERTGATRWLGMALGLVSVVAIGAAIRVAMPGVWGGGELAPVVLEEGAPLVVDKAALRTIDLAEVHEELVPSWVVARGGMRELQLKTLSKALRADRSLVAIIERIGQLAESDPVLNAAELKALVATWNAYLDAAGEPWRMEGEVVVNLGDDLFALRTYRVIYDGETRVGKHTYRTRLQRRADDTTQVEPYLGHVQSWKEGVLLLHDRIRDYTLDEVWVLLDEDLDVGDDPIRRAFLEPLRAEMRSALGDEVVDRLAVAAAHRRAMLDVVAQVHSRHRCGSQFLISRVPWNGFQPADVARLEVHAAAAAHQECPDVTPEEARVLVTSSRRIREQEGLKDALERLIAWVAGAVVIHEARHAADDDGRAGNGAPLLCLDCPPELKRVGVLEASAYVASFAAPKRGVLSMYQACRLEAERTPVRAEAVAFLMERLGTTCVDGPPPDPVERGRGVEVELFGRLTPVDLLDFPVGLPATDLR